MNEIVNKFLLVGDKFMPEMHWRQPGFTYSACGPFTKNKERIQKFEKTGDTNYINKNELDKACFQHDMAYGDFKDLARRIAADKFLRDKAFKIASDPKYDGYQRGLTSMVYKFFYKKSSRIGRPLSSASRVANNEIKQNMQLADELHKPMIRKYKKRKVYSLFRDNIWGADLADMQLFSKFHKGFRFVLCIIDIYSKFSWVIPSRDKKGVSIVDAFQKLLKEFNRKPNKIWVDKGSKFYDNLFNKMAKR